MLWFGRVELYMGFSPGECFAVREALSAAGIRYDWKIVDSVNPSGGRLGRFTPARGGPLDRLYYVYVRRRDAGRAQAILQSQK